LFEHDLFGKPVSTFPDHALKTQWPPGIERPGGLADVVPTQKQGRFPTHRALIVRKIRYQQAYEIGSEQIFHSFVAARQYRRR
jgi:hypothetical protein